MSIKFSMHAVQHGAREHSLDRRQRVEKSKRQPARPAQQRNVRSKNPEQTVRECDAGPTIGRTVP
jgi:hypothetical protein